MGARLVRQTLRDFIASTAGITECYKDEPHFVAAEAWYTEDGTHGTVAYVHLDQEGESRMVVTGFPESGQKITYHVGLVLLYEYLIPDDEASPDQWVDGLDDLLDALKTRLRSDPTLGLGPTGRLYSAQHDDTLTIQRDLPKRDGQYVRSWNVLTFQVTEVLV